MNEMALSLSKGDKVLYSDGKVYIVDSVRNDLKLDGVVRIKAHKGKDSLGFQDAKDFELVWK